LAFTIFDRIACLVGAVLSDKGKKAMYDAGLFDPLDDDDQVNLHSVSFPVLFFFPGSCCLLSRRNQSNPFAILCHFVREYLYVYHVA